MTMTVMVYVRTGGRRRCEWIRNRKRYADRLVKKKRTWFLGIFPLVQRNIVLYLRSLPLQVVNFFPFVPTGIPSFAMPSLLPLLLTALPLAHALTISSLNGRNFLSPYVDTTVSNVTGVVTAKSADGLFLRSPFPDNDVRTSDSIYVFGRSFGSNLTVGDTIVVGGKIVEYRSAKDYLFLTELSAPVLERKVGSGAVVKPLVIGTDTAKPPTKKFSGLDEGGVFGVPNNKSLVSAANPVLQPQTYGLDFWESLTGELVTVKRPTVLTKPNQYGDTWVVGGDWKATGRNGRGGLTMTAKDSNPEAIVIGTPLDGTKNPTDTKMGDEIEEITGVVTYAFGFYRILPTTAIKVVKSIEPRVPGKTKLVSSGKCNGVTFGAYNVENLAPNSTHHGALATHIVEYMRSPDIIFVQEVQDDNGPTNDGGEFPRIPQVLFWFVDMLSKAKASYILFGLLRILCKSHCTRSAHVTTSCGDTDLL